MFILVKEIKKIITKHNHGVKGTEKAELFLLLIFKKFIHLAVPDLVAAFRIFSRGTRTLSCSVWDLVP